MPDSAEDLLGPDAPVDNADVRDAAPPEAGALKPRRFEVRTITETGLPCEPECASERDSNDEVAAAALPLAVEPTVETLGGADGVRGRSAHPAGDGIKAPMEPSVDQCLSEPHRDGRGDTQRCTVALVRHERTAEFRVVVLGNSGRRRVAAVSPTFRVRRWRRVRNRGEPRAAHAALVKELLDSGWTPLEVRGQWYDTAFVREPDEPRVPTRQLRVGCRHDGTEGRFYAEEVADSGDRRFRFSSTRFTVELRGSRVCPTEAAMNAHDALIDELQEAGWTATDAGRPEWYSRVYERPQEAEQRSAGG